jgi:hypothetical protein
LLIIFIAPLLSFAFAHPRFSPLYRWSGFLGRLAKSSHHEYDFFLEGNAKGNLKKRNVNDRISRSKYSNSICKAMLVYPYGNPSCVNTKTSKSIQATSLNSRKLQRSPARPCSEFSSLQPTCYLRHGVSISSLISPILDGPPSHIILDNECEPFNLPLRVQKSGGSSSATMSWTNSTKFCIFPVSPNASGQIPSAGIRMAKPISVPGLAETLNDIHEPDLL